MDVYEQALHEYSKQLIMASGPTQSVMDVYQSYVPVSAYCQTQKIANYPFVAALDRYDGTQKTSWLWMSG